MKDLANEMDKLMKDARKITMHINRLEGREGDGSGGEDGARRRSTGSIGANSIGDSWLFAEFDGDTPLLFHDIDVVDTTGSSGGEPVSKYDICTIL